MSLISLHQGNKKQSAKRNEKCILEIYWIWILNFEFEFIVESGTLYPTPDDKSSKVGKGFWSYIKKLKKDSCGITPLKEDGQMVSDNKGKADILNRQYQSVFTIEDLTSLQTSSPT